MKPFTAKLTKWMNWKCTDICGKRLQKGGAITVKDVTKGFTFETEAVLTQRQRDIVLAGGLLNYTREHQA